MSAQTPRLDDQLCFAVYAASRAIVQAYRPMLSELGLTYPQFLVLLVLWETDDCTVGELGERLMLDSGTLTPLLKRLERSELVERRRDPGDERRVRVRLTPAGHALGPRAANAHAALLCAAPWSPDDLAGLRDRLKAITRAVRPG